MMASRILGALIGVMLAAWLALATAGGLAAAAVFPISRTLPISLAGYERYLAANPELGRMLVAGHLVESVFVLTDRVRPFVALAAVTMLALGTLAGHATAGARRLLAVACSAALLGAGASLAGSLHFQPAFQLVDAGYRDAARSSDTEEALRRKALVDAAHASASRVATLEAVAVLAAIAAFAAAGFGRVPAAPSHPETTHA